MTDGPALAFRTMAAGETHLIVMILLLPFCAIFLRAAWLEYRRWSIYGPSQNRRAMFPIDETAPGFDLPDLEAEPVPAGRLPRG